MKRSKMESGAFDPDKIEAETKQQLDFCALCYALSDPDKGVAHEARAGIRRLAAKAPELLLFLPTVISGTATSPN